MDLSFSIHGQYPSQVPLVELCFPNERYERRKLQNRRSQRTHRSRRGGKTPGQTTGKGDLISPSSQSDFLVTEIQSSNFAQANFRLEPPFSHDRSYNSSPMSSIPRTDAGLMPSLLNDFDLGDLSGAQSIKSHSGFSLDSGEQNNYIDLIPPVEITRPEQSEQMTRMTQEKVNTDMDWSFNTLPISEELRQHYTWAPNLPTSTHSEQMTQLPGQSSMEPAPFYSLPPPQSLPSRCASLPSPSASRTQTKEQSQDWHLPLHIAVEQGHELIIRELLRASVGINESDSAGRTAVHIAVHQKQEGILRILLEHGPDVNAIDKMGWTPVHHAAQNGFTSGLKLLLEHGSNLALRAPKRSPCLMPWS